MHSDAVDFLGFTGHSEPGKFFCPLVLGHLLNIVDDLFLSAFPVLL